MKFRTIAEKEINMFYRISRSALSDNETEPHALSKMAGKMAVAWGCFILADVAALISSRESVLGLEKIKS